MASYLVLTFPSTDPMLQHDIEHGLEPYANVLQAKSYTDTETIKLILDVVSTGVNIASAVVTILSFLRTLKQEREQQGYAIHMTIGIYGQLEVPIEQTDEELLIQLLQESV